MDISTTEKQFTTLTDIPIQLVEEIYTYLDSIDIVRLRSVSKSIQEFLDSLDQTESLNDSDVNSILHFAIRNNNIEVANECIPKYRLDPLRYPPKDLAKFRITGIRQLNWYRPIWLRYENSTILETSLDLTNFLEDVEDLRIINMINTTDPSLRQKRVDNLCAKLCGMQRMGKFLCRDENLTEEELAKIVQSLKFFPIDDMICLTLNGNISFYKKSIMSDILKATQMAKFVLIDCTHYIERDFDEDDYEGIELFMKTESTDIERVLNLGQCPESVCEKLVELSQKWFGRGETSYGEITNGNNCVIFRENE